MNRMRAPTTRLRRQAVQKGSGAAGGVGGRPLPIGPGGSGEGIDGGAGATS